MTWLDDVVNSVGSAFDSAYSGARDTFNSMINAIGEALFPTGPQRDVTDEIRRTAETAAPVIWLLGKAQSGKTSIVRSITGSTEAEVGQGYKACTKRSRIYNYPSDIPTIRFLDTRGIGEVGYDPTEDIAYCESSSHLVMAVMKASDPEQDALAGILREVCKKHPDWPIVIVQTTLHDLYRHGESHLEPYPFTPSEEPALSAPVNADLRKCLRFQRTSSAFADLGRSGPVWWVPVDLTDPDDGYAPADYGRETLLQTLKEASPAALKLVLDAIGETIGTELSQRAHGHIMGYAIAAGASDVLPAAGIALVPAIQAKMIHSLAAIYGVEWTQARWNEFVGIIGTGALLRYLGGFAIREAVKFIPVYGQTAGAAAAALYSFATTYAVGVGVDAYLRHLVIGGAVDHEDVKRRFEEAFSSGSDIFRESDIYKRLGLLIGKQG